MRIEKIDWFRLEPKVVKESWSDDTSVWPTTPPCFIVRVATDKGITGIGEATSQVWYYGETPDQIRSCLELYGAALKGADAENIALCQHKMGMTYSGGMPGGRSARAGVEMALLDAMGKHRGLTVAALLGGARRMRLEQLTNLYHKTPESMADACRSFVTKGFRGLKIKVGDVVLQKGLSYPALEEELSFLEAALATVPRDVMIDADANQGWRNPKLATAKISRFDRHDNLALEQPLHYANIEGHREVRMTTRVPVILDESIHSPEAAMQAVRSGACDRVVVKACRVGGLTMARQVMAICEAAGLGVSIDTAPYTLVGDTAHVHLAATAADPYPVDCDGHITFYKLADPGALIGGLTFDGPMAVVPDAPGLGIDADWGKLAKIAVEHSGPKG
ncbi:MAG: mandelate racemase/muconate lactonizing enzyme family protein [Hyphomicrobiaceae bacterium]